MVQVDPDELMESSYVIVRQAVPPGQLDELRAAFEHMFETQRARALRDEKPDDPPGGTWEQSRQRRVFIDQAVDQRSAGIVDFLLGENVRGVSQAVMRSPEVAILGMNSLNNPVHAYGPDPWHRDVRPSLAPLESLQRDLLANARPAQVQWNIALYDDDILWVVPGSHRRPNTADEDLQLREDPRQPLPGGIAVKLEAGDGVVYTNLNLHWGSNYTPKRRRTLHLGYRSVGGPMFPYYPFAFWDLELGFGENLSPSARDLLAADARRYAAERKQIVALFRAIVDRDEAAFATALERLHPGREDRLTCLILLRHVAPRIRTLADPAVAIGSRADRARAVDIPEVHLDQYLDIAGAFTNVELAALNRPFAALDARLRTPGEPGAYADRLPADVGPEQFVADWRAH